MIDLVRFYYSDFGTFGNLTLPSGLQLATVERPWLNNRPRVSCIPVGVYTCEPRRYNKGGYNAVEVTGVTGRTHILFHKGNFVRNSNGCILLNSEHGTKGNECCGWGSAEAFEAFMAELGRHKFTLKISDIKGGKIEH